MGKREERKEDKRAQIIEAARKLMHARNTPGFSMRTLAEVAGVSIATPYNLFGSKQAIIAAVMDTDLDEYQDALMAGADDPIDVFFRCVTVCTELFSASPGYYKAGADAIQANPDDPLTTHFGLPRHALLRDLVVNSIQQGYLSHRVNADSLAVMLGQQLFGWIVAWAKDSISLEELEARAHYGIALTLASVANDPWKAQLIERAMKVQASLPESTPTRLRAAR